MKTVSVLMRASLLCLAAPAIASDVTIPNTFSTGTPAQASQVNANFSALESAVDDNDSRLDALEPSLTPVVVDCSGNANALQAALDSPRTGKLLINFSGTCNPVLIARSNVEIVGASRATAKIAGATGAWNSSVTIKNANYVKLKTLTIQRSDDMFMLGSAWRSNVTLDDVMMDHTTAGAPAQEGFAFIQSKGVLTNVDAQSIGVYIGSSAIFEDGNEIINTIGSSALEINESSTLVVLGNNNIITSTIDVIDMASESSLGFNSDGSTGNVVSGDIYISQSSINFANSVSVSGNISINQGSSVYWEGSDGGPRSAVTANIQVHTNSNLQLVDVDLTGSTMGMRGSSITAQSSSISAGIELHSFSTFYGWDNTTINGGILQSQTNFGLSGPVSNISGSWTMYQGNGGWMDATHTGATFNCADPGHGEIYVQAYNGLPGGNGVCHDGDSDGFLNYLDTCPSVPGVGPDGCP